ncbi:hypothetical protein J3B02_003423 [Coemansia erecta]|uniref:CRAL-TRIO domain-containing protein n=1 Tax=Coemansia asiatica TaxID=1052880 RepID=A0A9W7XMI8_9FUNG|nr:hypothetical protein LPJ64_002704 [Coemansia asiatica]KAJ2852821.1 hypothetical protein J3B02_003423 [Coemansia erecta]KAJ2887551.1 hypothetical protein FB639_001232 [Coemansia asiatica]
MTNPVLEQYNTGKLIVEGTFEHLTPEQTKLLQALWTKLFDSFDKSADELKSAPLPADVAGESNASKDSSNNNRSSSAPISSRSSRQHLRAAAAPSPTSSVSSGWFGWGSSSTKAAESVEYRQLVQDVVQEESQPPEFVDQQQKQSIRSAFWHAVLCDHPDVLLLRFLRARKWQVDDALDMLLKCLRWRIDEELDRVVWQGEGPLNLALMRRGIGAVHKTDRIGQPVLHIPVKLNDPKAQPSDHMIDFTVYLMEVARVVLHPPAEKVCLVFDTTDMSLSNMDWTFFRTFLHYLEHYYPECLGLVLIYNASWVFNGLWKLIRPLLDPVVASKVHFLGSREEIKQFIDPKNLPKHFGGKEKFSYEYPMPQPGENSAMFDSVARQAALDRRAEACEKLEEVTKKWTLEKDSQEIDQERDQAARDLVAASKELDRYVRARTLYHRLGVIGDDLTVNWKNS